ncbi:hypothetical protein [Candidatus Lokiarchaeum ossiferum]|uniref:hypothetical protein n=1 Tax=Candidatus Lokiarchaeum ossiferum TaxID=2951803 RepID=UPI00352DCA1B
MESIIREDLLKQIEEIRLMISELDESHYEDLEVSTIFKTEKQEFDIEQTIEEIKKTVDYIYCNQKDLVYCE